MQTANCVGYIKFLCKAYDEFMYTEKPTVCKCMHTITTFFLKR